MNSSQVKKCYLFYQSQTIQQGIFTYFPFGKVIEKQIKTSLGFKIFRAC